MDIMDILNLYPHLNDMSFTHVNLPMSHLGAPNSTRATTVPLLLPDRN